MSIKENPSDASELEEAWKSGDVQACYRYLDSISDEHKFQIGDLSFRVTASSDEEKKLMERSIQNRREYGLIKTVDKIVIIDGFEGGVDLDEISKALYQNISPDKPAIFSHTHWDSAKHPLPGYAEIGFGDIPLFEFFKATYPLLECRAVFNGSGSVRTIIYEGKK
jgi:hypothetical protein